MTAMITRVERRRVKAMPANIPRKGVNSSGTGDSESGTGKRIAIKKVGSSYVHKRALLTKIPGQKRKLYDLRSQSGIHSGNCLTGDE